MNSEQKKLFDFYCWQLKIKTAQDLASFKATHNARTNTETLEAMKKAYNGSEWEQINNQD